LSKPKYQQFTLDLGEGTDIGKNIVPKVGETGKNTESQFTQQRGRGTTKDQCWVGKPVVQFTNYGVSCGQAGALPGSHSKYQRKVPCDSSRARKEAILKYSRVLCSSQCLPSGEAGESELSQDSINI
jgi:hypothetical protein